MCKVISILLLICASGFVTEAQVVSQPRAQMEREHRDAKHLWEQMIEVKGGRERLHSVSNMMIEQMSNKPGESEPLQKEFYVYPDKYWEWSKGKIVYEYGLVTMANLTRGVSSVASRDGVVEYSKNLSDMDRASYRESYLMKACRFLLETKWLQPEPVRVTRQKIGKETFDVVETHFSTLKKYKDSRQDFYVDPESLVVKGVASYSANGRIYEYLSFEKYERVDGILVPASYAASFEVKPLRKKAYSPLRFHLNLLFDESLFEKPPSVEAGPEAWKQKSN